MSARPPIGDVMKNLGKRVVQQSSTIVAGAMIKWIEDHREELVLAVVQCEHERASRFLHAFCERFPWAAGGISLAMNGSPEMAIAAIRAYDAQLGNELWEQREKFIALQEHWRRAEAQQQKQS